MRLIFDRLRRHDHALAPKLDERGETPAQILMERRRKRLAWILGILDERQVSYQPGVTTLCRLSFTGTAVGMTLPARFLNQANDHFI